METDSVVDQGGDGPDVGRDDGRRTGGTESDVMTDVGREGVVNEGHDEK